MSIARPRILYLADRNILVDEPKDKIFAPFGDARCKIEGEAVKSREMYFAIYQGIASDSNRPASTGSIPATSSTSSSWTSVIAAAPGTKATGGKSSNTSRHAFQVGMTATPLREDNRDTYRYFGNPIYTYSLRQGIDDGFLAPYRVHRIVSTWMRRAGVLPPANSTAMDARFPTACIGTPEFERIIALRARTQAIARNLTDFMKKTDRFAKTIVFCVDQEHAEEMRKALNNCNTDLVQQYPDYVVPGRLRRGRHRARPT